MGELQTTLLRIFHKHCQPLTLQIWKENGSNGIAEVSLDLMQLKEDLMSYYKPARTTYWQQLVFSKEQHEGSLRSMQLLNGLPSTMQSLISVFES